MGTCISIPGETSRLEQAEAESAVLRERVRELEIQNHSRGKEQLRRTRSTSDLGDASTLIQSPATGATKSPTSPSYDPTDLLLEMEGQLEFLEGQRQLQKDLEAKGVLSKHQSERMSRRWKDDSMQLMQRILAAEEINKSLSEELAAARIKMSEQVAAKRLEVVTDELASTEAALAVCLALLKADPRRNNAAHCRDAAKFMEPLRFRSRMRMRADLSTMALTQTD